MTESNRIDKLEKRIKDLDFCYSSLWTALDERIKKLETYIQQQVENNRQYLTAFQEMITKAIPKKSDVQVFDLDKVMGGIEKELNEKEDSD